MYVDGILLRGFCFYPLTDAIKAVRKYKDLLLVETFFSNFALQSFHFFSGPELQNIGNTN